MGFLISFLYTLGSVIDLWFTTDIFNATPNSEGFVIPNFPDIFDWRFFLVIPLWIFMMVISIIAIRIGFYKFRHPTSVRTEDLKDE